MSTRVQVRDARDDDLDVILGDFWSRTGPHVPSLPPVESLDDMNVHRLRGLARSLPKFPLRGREISHATRDQLLGHLKEILKTSDPTSGKAEA